MISTNFRGLRSKKESFIHLIHAETPHFIAGTETWLNPNVYTSEIFPPNYQVFRRDREDGYGGVFFACHNTINCTQIPIHTLCEAVACKIKLSDGRMLIVLTIYRPPERNLQYMKNVCNLIEQLCCKYVNAVMWITGDFNLPNINWNLNSVVSNEYSLELCNILLDIFNSFGFTQLVESPTRGNNILDLFVTNRPGLIQKVTVSPGLSDHELIIIESSLVATLTESQPRTVYLWHQADWQAINERLSNFSNNFLSNYSVDTSIQDLWNSFKWECHSCLDLIPCKTLSQSPKHPWINTQIKRLSSKKKRLYNKARNSCLESDWKAYKELKKQVQRECRKAHNTYVSKLINSNNSSGNKRFWSYVKSKRNDQCEIPTLEKDNQIFTDSLDKANILNKHFSSVFTKPNIPAEHISLEGHPYPDITPLIIEANGIKRLLHNLDPNKAQGPDGISPRFLKETSESIAPVLALIFNASFQQGKLPSDWKNAYVVPAFKKGSRADPSNYRPISLTCICCKLFEHIIVSSISEHANAYNIICREQHGFRKNHSCETQLLETINDLSTSLNSGNQIDFLLLDFSKAFDKVSHPHLLHKLSNYGIRGSLLDWITDFLNDRKQQVILQNKKSQSCTVLSGVPQGSVLGPLLFNLFINDLPSKVISKIRLYADDVILYREIHSEADVSILQKDLDSIAQWADTWLMKLNLSKCEHLTITNKKSPLNSTYNLNSHPLCKVTSAKYLGVIINHNLSWSDHIVAISNKANSMRAFLQRNLRQCSPSTKSLAYLTYVRPIVEYASTVWSPYVKSDIERLEMVQRKAARFVYNNFSTYSSVSSMLSQLNWQSLEERRTNAIVTMFYKIINNLISIDFSHDLRPVMSSTRGYLKRFISLPARINSYYHSFLPHSIRIWNSLPEILVTAPDLNSFSNRLQFCSVN